MLNKILKGLGITITTVLMLVSCSKKSSNNIVIYSCAEDYRNEFYLDEAITENLILQLRYVEEFIHISLC